MTWHSIQSEKNNNNHDDSRFQFDVFSSSASTGMNKKSTPKAPLRDRYKELLDDMAVLQTAVLCTQPEDSPLHVETKRMASKWSKKVGGGGRNDICSLSLTVSCSALWVRPFE